MVLRQLVSLCTANKERISIKGCICAFFFKFFYFQARTTSIHLLCDIVPGLVEVVMALALPEGWGLCVLELCSEP